MTNPELLIIGAGPGGYVAAIRASQLGKKVLLVDNGLIGGVCLNCGCIPTKTLLHYTKILFDANNVSRAGIKFSKPEIDFKLFNEQIQNITTRLRKGIEFLLRANGVQYLHAQAKFINKSSLSLITSNSAEQIATPDFVIIATGSKQATLHGIEIDSKNIITSDQALVINEIPQILTIIGAGAIGLEFATIYQRLGSKVTVIEIMDRILPGTDVEITRHLMQIMKKQGIQFMLKAKVTKITKNNGLQIHVHSDKKEQVINTDKILIAVGRVPNTENLGLENTDIELTDKKIISINVYCETSQKQVYAVGDVIGQPLLAHKAMAQGIFVAEKITGKKDINPPSIIPNCIYTDPELATIGLSEEQAISEHYDIVIGKAPLSAIGRAHSLGQIDGLVKVILNKKTDNILGVHILAPEASNLISEINLAMNTGLKINDIIETVHPHPTLSEAVLEACATVHKKAIHIINR